MIKKTSGTFAQVATLDQHLFEQQQQFPSATGEFSHLLAAITSAAKMIQFQVRQAGLADILGEYGSENVQGESQQKLDVYANDAMISSLATRDCVAVVASEENEEPILFEDHLDCGKYAVVFDPLDGSSNIDVNVSVGTTFSIFRKPENGSIFDPEDWVLQSGARQVAAGYVVYGSSTVLVYTAGAGVHGFTLDPGIGEFVLSHPDMRMPNSGKYYSVNEAYRKSFPSYVNRFIDKLQSGFNGKTYASRYIGSLVADFHRTLLRGGIFIYPATATHPTGKLRLLYEANPIAFIAEQAGGLATDGTRRILDIAPLEVHQRVPLIVGSQTEMDAFENVAETTRRECRSKEKLRLQKFCHLKK